MTKRSYPLSIKHCRIISALSRHSGQSDASEALNISKSNISRGLKAAEESLGCMLFYRDRGGFLPTREGSIVTAYCLTIMEEIEAVESQLFNEGTPDLLLTPYIEWRHLEAVYMTEVLGKVADAAKELNLTQSAVSQTLTNLEYLARQKLFKRCSHGLEALRPAKILSALHQKLAADINGLSHALAVAPGVLTGRVFVGILPFTSNDDVIPRAIGMLSQRHPHLHIQSMQAPFQILMRSLHSGEIDCIFGTMREPDTFSDLKILPLFSSRYALAARVDHPAQRQAKCLEDLKNEQWLVWTPSSPPRVYFENLFKKKGLKPPVKTIETIGLNMNEQMLIYSDAVGLIVHQENQSLPLDPRLKILDIDLPNPECLLGLLIPKSGLPTPVAEFINILKEVIRDGSK